MRILILMLALPACSPSAQGGGSDASTEAIESDAAVEYMADPEPLPESNCDTEGDRKEAPPSNYPGECVCEVVDGWGTLQWRCYGPLPSGVEEPTTCYSICVKLVDVLACGETVTECTVQCESGSEQFSESCQPERAALLECLAAAPLDDWSCQEGRAEPLGATQCDPLGKLLIEC